MSSHRRYLRTSTGIGFAFFLLASVVWFGTAPVRAACTALPNTICSTNPPNPWPSTIGTGPTSPVGSTVDVQAGATVSTGNASAISLSDNAAITVRGGATVENNATKTGPSNYGTGLNTVEFRAGGSLVVEAGGQIISKGSAGNSEAVNVTGGGNTITNHGYILRDNSSGAAIWFENTYGTNIRNTVDNNGTIETKSGGNVIGSSGPGAVDFYNRENGVVKGSLLFGAGNDNLFLYTGSQITGSLTGGGGTDTITLRGLGFQSMDGNIQGFENLRKEEAGTWELTGSITGNMAVTVADGRLIVSGNNAAFTGTMTVDPAGTLQGNAGSLTPVITNNGQVLFQQDTTGTYSGLIQGSGAVTVTGAGVLTLTGPNTYKGGTTIDNGTLAVAADNALGDLSGPLTFSGGTLQVTGSSFTGTGRTINWGPNGGGFDIAEPSNTFTVSQVLSGGPLKVNELGGLGTLKLTGADTFILTDVFNGALVVDSITSPITVHAAGTLGGSGNSIINGQVDNFGTVEPGFELSAAGSKLTINGNYVGHDGKLKLKTVLGDNSSLTDQLVITGGGHTASGTTGIVVTNVDGPGALTSGKGIPIVLPTGGASITAGAFGPNGSVVPGAAAGIYQYLLYQGTGGDTTYYLRSHTDNDEPPGPIYRPDVSIHSVLATMARQQGLVTLGAFHDRNGDQRLAAGAGSRTGAWGRLFGQSVEQSHSGHVNAHFDGNMGGLQSGLDVAQWISASGHQDRLGVFAAYTRSTGDVRGFALGDPDRIAGRAELDGTSAGGYWTHLAPTGWYTDAVLMGTRFDGGGHTAVGTDFDATGYGVTASIEGGYAISLWGGLRLEPQAQLVYTHINIDNVDDPYSHVAYDTPDSLAGRVGFRLWADMMPLPMVLRPYLKANVWQDFTQTDRIRFAHVHEIESRHRATTLELGGGVVAQLSSSVGLWVSADYTTDFAGSDNERESVRGTAGLRVI